MNYQELGLDQLTNISEEQSNSNNKRQRVKHVFEESVETRKGQQEQENQKEDAYTATHIKPQLQDQSAALKTKKVNTLCSTCKLYTCIDCFNKNNAN